MPPSSDLTIIVADPILCALIMPLSTDTVDPSELDHTTFLLVAFSGYIVAVRSVESPSLRDIAASLMTISVSNRASVFCFFMARNKGRKQENRQENRLYEIFDHKVYPISAPLVRVSSGVTQRILPSPWRAMSIIPWLSMPLMVRGARFASMHICLPTICSGV